MMQNIDNIKLDRQEHKIIIYDNNYYYYNGHYAYYITYLEIFK